MNRDDISKVTRLLGIGVVVGASAGFMLGLLLAPQEGSTLRRRISYQMEDQLKKLREVVGTGGRGDDKKRGDGEALPFEVDEEAQEIIERIDEVLDDVQNRG